MIKNRPYFILLILILSLLVTPFLIGDKLSYSPIEDVQEITKNEDRSSRLYQFNSPDRVDLDDKSRIAQNQKKLQTNSEESGTILSTGDIGIDASGDFFWQDGVEINGTAIDDRDEVFPGITVYLFFNVSDVDLDPINATQNTVSGIDGFYTFPVSFLQSGLGNYNYTVWYPNQDNGGFGEPCFNCAKKLDSDIFTVVDRITFTSTLDSATEIGPAESIDFTMTANRTNGTPIPAGILSQLSYSYTIEYDINPGFNTADTIPFATQTQSASDTYGGTSPDNGTITFSINGAPTFYQLIHDPQNTELTFQISTDYEFILYNVDVGGTTYTQTQLANSQFFSRADQVVNISGRFHSAAIGAPSTPWENIPIEFDISGAGIPSNNESMFTTVNTDLDGYFWFTFSLSWENFSRPNAGNIIVDIYNTDTEDVIIEDDQSKQVTIRLKGEATTLDQIIYYRAINGSGHDEDNLYHFQDGRTFRISGRVLDSFGNPAQGVIIILHITDQIGPGAADPVSLYNSSDGTIPGASSGELTTSSDGTFDVTFTLPDIQLFQRYFTFNVTVSDAAVSSSYRWEDPSDLSSSIVSFEFIRSFDVDVSTVNFEVFNGSTFSNLGEFDAFFLDNVTYFDNYQNAGSGYFFQITIRDAFNRIPFNLTFTLDIDEAFHTVGLEADSTNTNEFTVNDINNGVFTFNVVDLTIFDTTTFENSETATFSYLFRVAEGESFNISSVTFGQQITTYGPDNTGVNPASIDVQFIPSQPQESAHDVTVYWNLPLGVNEAIFVGNLRYVNISYRFSPEGFNSTTISTFDFDSLPWIVDLMIYNTALNRFEYVFPFSSFGNGVFFQITVLIQDLAGFGIDETGATFGGGTWSGGVPDWNELGAIPGYDTSVSNFANITDLGGNPFLVKMGDTFIHNIDLSNDVRINGNSIANGFNITRIDQNITIDLFINVDPAGYVNVSLFYRLLENQTNSGLLSFDDLVFDPNQPYILVPMTLIGTISGISQYQYQISSSELFFGAYLDFYFYIEDGSGLNYTTIPFVSASGTPQNTIQFSVVIDLDPPVELNNNFLDRRILDGRGNSQDLIIIYDNETRTLFNVTYIFADFDGTGLSDVIVTWYYFNLTDGTPLGQIQEIYLENEILLISNFNSYNGTHMNLTLFIPASIFLTNTSISYEISALDVAGNELLMNPQDNEPDEFQIIPFPIPAVDVPTDSSVDPEEASNNAFFIVAGFIGILALLTLYYQRNNIREVLDRRSRRKRVEGTLEELTDEIRRLGAEMKFRRAILLVWEALERVSREILQAPRRYNQTAKEFAYYLSTVTIVDRDTLLTLSSTFETARYSKDEPTRDDFEDAIKALEITVKVIIDSGLRTRIADIDEDW